MGNKLGSMPRRLKRSNEKAYELLLPLSNSEKNDSFENMEVVEEPVQITPRVVSTDNLEGVPVQEASVDNMEVVEEPVQIAPEDVSNENVEAIEQFLQEHSEDISLENFSQENLDALERFLRGLPEDFPLENLEPQEQFSADLGYVPTENFEPSGENVSLGNMEDVEKILQETAEEMLPPSMEPPEQPLSGRSDEVPHLETPENPVARAPEISYSLRFFQCFPAVNDQEQFSAEEDMLNNDGFRAEVDLLYKIVPIELILNDDTTSYITHISAYNGLVREGTGWRLLDKFMDMTAIRSTNPYKTSKYFQFERDPTDNKWMLTYSHPYKNEYQGKRFNAPIIGVTATYFRDNMVFGKYVHLSKHPVIDLPTHITEATSVFHLTTYDIQLVKKSERLLIQGRDDEEGTEYYVRKRPERSFTPNFFSLINANAAEN